MFNSSSGRSHEHILNNNLFCFFVSDDSKCRNHPHHPPTSIWRCLLFGLKNQYKIVFNILNKIFFIVYDSNKNKKKWSDCIIGEGTLPWAIFRFRIFSNYFSEKFEKIKITVWQSDNLTMYGNFCLDLY